MGLHVFVCSRDVVCVTVILPLKGYGAVWWVLRELVVARVMALSGLLGCACVRSRRGELRRSVNALRANSGRA